MKLIRLILRRPTSVILMILAVVVFGSASPDRDASGVYA